MSRRLLCIWLNIGQSNITYIYRMTMVPSEVLWSCLTEYMGRITSHSYWVNSLLFLLVGCHVADPCCFEQGSTSLWRRAEVWRWSRRISWRSPRTWWRFRRRQGRSSRWLQALFWGNDIANAVLNLFIVVYRHHGFHLFLAYFSSSWFLFVV